jgi:hypothetical protein
MAKITRSVLLGPIDERYVRHLLPTNPPISS